MVKSFYVPLLENAVLYKRAVGFFSSTALVEISKGICGLIRNGGSIQLVASPHLSEDDIEAIKNGYRLRDETIKRALFESLEEPKNYFERERLNLLSNLIADGRLDIKIAFAEAENMLGMYHEKMGLMYDEDGNIVAFAGSMNETSTAIFSNYEAIDVFCSWTKDRDRALRKAEAFTRIWDNNELNIQVLDFPDVKKELIDKYKKSSIDLSIDQKQLSNEAIIFENYETRTGPHVPEDVVLYKYQTDAIDQWEKENYRGIFDMATGTGKTLTGLGAISRLSGNLRHKLAVFIVCPYQHLVEQWVDDIVRFNIRPIIAYSSSHQRDWRERLENAVRDQKLNVKGCGFFCFVTTNATFSSTFVQEQISRIRGDALIVVDEAHNFGTTRLLSTLTNVFKYRLALSATLERHNDEEGTGKLKGYFGNKCIVYPLERAIAEHKLAPYKYIPVIVSLNDKELAKYDELSNSILRCIIQDKHGKKHLSEKGKRLAIERARVVAAAESKLDKLREIIKPYQRKSHLLVYCGAASLLGEDDEYSNTSEEDIRQIDAVTHLLGNELNMKVSQFTAKEDIDEREVLKKEFAKGDNLQALIAIKCLDEGVNIPNIRVAFILASTTNPKEYIQRRGRVLRLATGKDFAEIYDFITIPRPLEEVSSLTESEANKDLTLVKNELNRAQEFARLSMNPMVAYSVMQQIRDIYHLYEDTYDYIDE
jgi:superfamily II DNA or RNA helicase